MVLALNVHIRLEHNRSTIGHMNWTSTIVDLKSLINERGGTRSFYANFMVLALNVHVRLEHNRSTIGHMNWTSTIVDLKSLIN